MKVSRIPFLKNNATANDLIRGGKRFGRLVGDWFSENNAVSASAAMSMKASLRSFGMPMAMRGAMIGGVGMTALQIGNNVLSGDSLFSGVPGAAFRGAALGGVAGIGYGTLRGLGRTGRQAVDPRRLPTNRLTRTSAWGFLEAGEAMPVGSAGYRTLDPYAWRRHERVLRANRGK